MATLGEKSVGSIVKLNVNGTAREFIVVHQGLPSAIYDSSCDGTWLLMKDIYTINTNDSIYDSTDNDYENSDVRIFLENSFFGLLDAGAREIIKQVKIPYRKGTGTSTTVSSGANGLSSKVFLLSYYEVGYSSNSYAPKEGVALAYFSDAYNTDNKIAYFEGKASPWWLRTPYTRSASAVMISRADGWESSYLANDNRNGVRPAMILTSDVEVSYDGTILVPSGVITGTVLVNGVQRELTGKGYINIDGVLRDLSDSRVNIGGTLKSLKG